MKKSFKKVISVVLCVVMLMGAASITSFAADDSMENIMNSLSSYLDAFKNFDMSDFNGFVTAILGLFGFKGTFEGVHSIPALMEEWVGWFGEIEVLYDSFINYINTAELVAIINSLLSGIA